MNTNDWQNKIQAIDNELSSKYPLNKRIWQTIKKIYPSIPPTGIDQLSCDDINLFFDVIKWYENQYPEQKHIIKALGYKPFILNNKIYHILINLDGASDENKSKQMLKDSIDDMTSLEKENLTDSDIKTIEDNFEKGKEFLRQVYDLEAEIEDNKLQDKRSELFASGIWDINIALSVLKNPFYLDEQPIMFHCHQAVEKFLKALYVGVSRTKIQEYINNNKENNKEKTIDDYLKVKIGHDLKKLDKELESNFADWNIIQSDIGNLQNEVPDMNIRYQNSDKTIYDAIKCIDLMIGICGYTTKKYLN
jgi:hypothetical protein